MKTEKMNIDLRVICACGGTMEVWQNTYPHFKPDLVAKEYQLMCPECMMQSRKFKTTEDLLAYWTPKVQPRQQEEEVLNKAEVEEIQRHILQTLNDNLGLASQLEEMAKKLGSFIFALKEVKPPSSFPKIRKISKA